jgi:hypothetical protein
MPGWEYRIAEVKLGKSYLGDGWEPVSISVQWGEFSAHCWVLLRRVVE